MRVLTQASLPRISPTLQGSRVILLFVDASLQLALAVGQQVLFFHLFAQPIALRVAPKIGANCTHTVAASGAVLSVAQLHGFVMTMPAPWKKDNGLSTDIIFPHTQVHGQQSKHWTTKLNGQSNGMEHQCIGALQLPSMEQ